MWQDQGLFGVSSSFSNQRLTSREYADFEMEVIMSVDKTINVLEQLGGKTRHYHNKDGEWEFTVITVGGNNETTNKTTTDSDDKES